MLRNPVTASLLATSAILLGSIETAEAGQQQANSTQRGARAATASQPLQAQNPRRAAGVVQHQSSSFGAKAFGSNGYSPKAFAKKGYGAKMFGVGVSRHRNVGWKTTWNTQANAQWPHQPWYPQWNQQVNHGLNAPIAAPVVCHAPPPHVHAFDVIFEQEWVDPVFQTITVGYQSCGTPIFQEVLVQAGYFRTAKYELCGCGEKVFVGYV